METLAEFQCPRRSSEDEIWRKIDVRVADLRLRVQDNNLVIFEYFNGDEIIGTYRLCWRGFMEFVHNFQQWFLEDEPSNGITASCVDKEQSMIRCMVHDDLVASFTIGMDKPEVAFFANRGDILMMFDLAVRHVAKLPSSGCFRNQTVALTEETLEKLERKGHTVH